ncbi:FixH family protein [Thioclava sp. GXIMD4216]|uniref:FixH family protein n=1 Tax=Thioclava litoralis TaxID=3076557 RepID=A0ABZ1DV89_9RHOB|nr:FixH family protein [Thioclava sp. FTW29]
MMTRELTGKHVLVTVVGAFSVIIGVNIFMAYNAISSFPGLEVTNSYVASQQFDTLRAAQQALGWTVEPLYENGQLSFRLTDKEGLPAPVSRFSALVGRTTMSREDVTPQFRRVNGAYLADLTLAPGAWLVHLDAVAADGTAFRQRIDLFVRN